jgi:hypothetical protein
MPGMPQTALRHSGRASNDSRHWTATSRLFGRLLWTSAASVFKKGCMRCVRKGFGSELRCTCQYMGKYFRNSAEVGVPEQYSQDLCSFELHEVVLCLGVEGP